MHSIKQIGQQSSFTFVQPGQHATIDALAVHLHALRFALAGCGQAQLLHALVVRRWRRLQETAVNQHAHQASHLRLVPTGVLHKVTRTGAWPPRKEPQRPPLHERGSVGLASRCLLQVPAHAVHEGVEFLANVDTGMLRIDGDVRQTVDIINLFRHNVDIINLPGCFVQPFTMTKFRAIAPMFAFGALTCLTITAVVTWVQLGLAPNFLSQWGQAAALSIAVMLPSGALVMASVAAAVRRLLRQSPIWIQRVVMALAMGLVMEAVASALSTITNLGIQDFLSNWLHAYWRAAPLALVIGPFMVFVLRPWVERRLARVDGASTGVAV